MLTSISPLGERARHNRWAVTVAWYTVASILAASAAGALLGGLGAVIGLGDPAAAATLAVVGVIAAVTDGAGRPVVVWGRQVNEDWLGRYRGWVYGAGFGGQLGLGVATIVTSASVYVVLLAEFFARDALAGALIGATFGLVRALPVLSGGRVATFDQLAVRHRRLMAALPTVRWLTVAGLMVAAAAWSVIALGWQR